MTLPEFNRLDGAAAEALLLRCCGSRKWVRTMVSRRPFETLGLLTAAADEACVDLDRSDWLEAFAAHPRIGGLDPARTPEAKSGFDERDEQRGALTASTAVQERLAAANRAYEARFGYIFIICAAGRSGDEMLAECERRLSSDPSAELAAAAEEQRRIMHSRLAKMFEPARKRS